MKKRIIALLLVLAMMAGMLAGCGKVEDSSEPAVDSGNVEANNEPKEETSDGLTTVRVLAPNWLNATTNLEMSQWEEYPSSQIFIKDLEEYGVRLELECINADNYVELVKARMASGVDMPDIISYAYGDAKQADVAEWAEAGLVYPLDELLDQYDEDNSIRTFIDETIPGLWGANTMEDGHNYWFASGISGKPKLDKNTNEEYLHVTNVPGITVREDWVKAVGEEVKDVYSTDELFALAKKMRDEDANGNGKNDEVVYANPQEFGGIAMAFGLHNELLASVYKNEDKVVSNFYHENFPDYIKYMNALFEEGLLDPSCMSVSSAEMSASDVVSVQTNDYAVEVWETRMPEGWDGYYAPVIVDQDGNVDNGFTTCVDNYTMTNSGAFFIPKGAENPEAAIRLMDYIHTTEYLYLNVYGIEDVSYYMYEGYPVVDYQVWCTSVDTMAFVLTGVGLFAFPDLEDCRWATVREYGDLSTAAQKRDYWLYEKFQDTYFPKVDQIVERNIAYGITTDAEQEFLSENEATLKTYAEELLVDLILGNKDIEDLPEYLAELEELGMTEYLTVQQARRDRVVG